MAFTISLPFSGGLLIPWTEFTLAWKRPNKFVSSSSRGSWIELWNFEHLWTSYLQPSLPFRPPSSPSCPPPSWQPWSMFVLTSSQNGYCSTFKRFLASVTPCAINLSRRSKFVGRRRISHSRLVAPSSRWPWWASSSSPVFEMQMFSSSPSQFE